MSAALLDDSLDQNVELWKIRKLIKSLEACRGLVSSRLFKNIIINSSEEIQKY